MLDRFAVRLAPSAPYPDGRVAVRAAIAGDWAGCRQVIDGAEASARTWLIRQVGEHDGLGNLAALAVDADPEDATAAAVRTFQLIHQGWQVRTRARAKYVSARQFEVFHRYLAEAERVLYAGLTRSAHDPALWTASLVTARGLQLGLDQARYRYDCLAAFDPHHLPGQSELLQQLCPKWSGAWSLAEEFARNAMRAAPEGEHNAVLIVDYHLENWADENGTAGSLRTGRVRTDLEEAADRSVRHPAFRRTVGWIGVVNSFAMAFSLADDHANARQMFAMLGPYASDYPWRIQPTDVPTAFRRARVRAYGLSGGLPAAADALVVLASPAIRTVRHYVLN